MNQSEKFWDKKAAQYDEKLERYGIIKTRTIKRTEKYLKSTDVVLDYGCGTGIVTFKIAENVKEIYGIDISSKMIEAAKKKANDNGGRNIHFNKSTIFDEKLKNESFDVILAIGILHLIKDPQEVIKRVSELLKPGGLFISSTPCIGENKAIPVLMNSIVCFLSKIGIFPTFRFFIISKLENIIAYEGFQVIESISQKFESHANESETNSTAFIVAHFIAAKKK